MGARGRDADRARRGVLLLAALLVLAPAFAPRAEAFVYWTDANPSTGAIARANLDGTGVDRRFITGASFPTGLAVDAAHVYWADGGAGAIGRANLDGTGVDQRFIAGAGRPLGVAVDAAHVYWTDSSTGAIARANLDGSGIEPSFITGASGAVGLAVDAAHVYWTTNAIVRANLDGSGVDQSFIFANGPRRVAVDAEHLYWTAASSTIARANLDGSGVEPSFITGASESLGLAVDAAHVYWTSGYRTIGRANLDGSGIEPSFITGPGYPQAIAVNFSLAKLRKDKKRGTAKLTVEVPAPGGVALAETQKLKGAEVRAEAAGEVRLPIEPQGTAKKKLANKGRAKVAAEVTYTPDGGEAKTQSKRIKLVKR